MLHLQVAACFSNICYKYLVCYIQHVEKRVVLHVKFSLFLCGFNQIWNALTHFIKLPTIRLNEIRSVFLGFRYACRQVGRI
jgi:hypothetical protein